jgi:hypothetical protein
VVNAQRAAAEYNLGHTGAQDDLGVLLPDLLDLSDLDGVSSRELSRGHVCLHWRRFAPQNGSTMMCTSSRLGTGFAVRAHT